MNNEVNNNFNNELNVKPSNNSKIIIVILVILLIGALGFICYDKFINKEKPPVPTSTPTPTPTIDKSITVERLDTIKLTTVNQNIKIGNNNYSVRINSEDDYNLYINDSLISSDFAVDTVYTIDNFAFFTFYGKFDSSIYYAIDSNGKEIKVEDNNYYIHDIHLDNGLIVGKGMTVTDALDEDSNTTEVELVVKYENNTITVTKK